MREDGQTSVRVAVQAEYHYEFIMSKLTYIAHVHVAGQAELADQTYGLRTRAMSPNSYR